MEDIGDVLERACRGDNEALSLLYRRFLPGIFGYIALRVPQRSIAEDLTSDVFLAMVENIYQLRARDEAGFAAWLLRIARITVAGYYRKQGHQPALLSLELSLSEDQRERLAGGSLLSEHLTGDPVHLAEVHEEWHTLVHAINTLTEEQRQVLVGRLIFEYDIATVARMVGKKGNAVKALQFRALKSLRRLLKGPQSEESVSQPPREAQS